MNYTGYTNKRRQEYEHMLADGIAAFRAGRVPYARRVLTRATELLPADARAWLWLAMMAENRDEQIAFLEHAVAADPGNPGPRQELARLKGLIPAEERVLEPGQGMDIPKREQPLPVEVEQAYMCPQCGAHLAYNPQAGAVTCANCGYQASIEAPVVADSGEQVLDFALPTERGHRWAENYQHFLCSRCGADSLLPPTQKAIACPYCGSSQLIASPETKALLPTVAVGELRINEEQAIAAANHWLGKGWFTPDDLLEKPLRPSLRLAFYPFWTFDGTLELNWRCEVNEGTNNNPVWVPRSGVEYEMFDDVLVSGCKVLDDELVERILPFDLKAVRAFKPEFIAGWAALTYDISLAKASLTARERVSRKLRRVLYRKVLPYAEKRNLTSGATRWMDMTYKQVLLPIWVGHYTYRGKRYPILVNGQSGVAGGEKPRDTVKAVAIVLSAILTVLFLLMLGFIAGKSLGWF